MQLSKQLLKLLIFVFTAPSVLTAQDISYAKDIVNELASAKYNGRGYVKKGEANAASFIASEFQRLGLKAFSDNYFQKFNIQVNTFPKDIKLVVDGKSLQPGSDYMVDAGSTSSKGKFNPVWISKKELLNPNILRSKIDETKENFLIIDNTMKRDSTAEKDIKEILQLLKYSPNINISGIIELTQQKLTWNAATYTLPHPFIQLQVDSCETDTIITIETSIQNKFFDKYQTQNVVGYLNGTVQTDSFIVFIAHYDHLGKMGNDIYFPGANDNASGIAMLLSLARYFNQHPPTCSIVFIALGAEEAGLLGAKYFTEHPLFNLNRIKFLINFDLAGTGDLGIQVVNGTVYKDKFDMLCEINKEEDLLPQIKIRGEACNSDHCMFHRKGVPCFYIYTLGGINAYHDLNDRAETLPLTEFSDYLKLITIFVYKLNIK